MTTCPACSRPVAEGKTDLIGQAACAEIRRLLNLHEVPVAAFIDDHVLNAIRQRDEAWALIERLEKAVERTREAFVAIKDIQLPADAVCLIVEASVLCAAASKPDGSASK